MTNKEILAELMKSDGDPIWMGQALLLMESIDGTGLNPLQPAPELLDDMSAIQDTNPNVKRFIHNLPGFSAGHREVAERQLGYLTDYIKAIAA